MELYDIIVVGGGASGMAAAVAAARELKNTGRTAKLLVIDGNKKLGRKLLATGNGRCNLTNMNASPEHYFGDVKFASRLFDEYTPEKICSFFSSLGLMTTADSEGRVYPYNKQAAAVLEMLRISAADMGAEFMTEFTVSSVSKKGKNYVLASDDGRELVARKCIIATGGKASPELLCATNGYELAATFGHSCSGMYPVLLQLKSEDKFLKNLSGMRCKADVGLLADGVLIHAESGELLFADKCISGICVFALSLYAGEHFATGCIAGKKYGKLTVKADLAPDFSYDQLRSYLRELSASHPQIAAADMLSGLLNMKVGREIIRRCGIDPALPIGDIRKDKFELIIKNIKSLELPISGTKGWSSAQVTAGGIPLKEVNINTMESRFAPGLHLCGELLNIHGECGGFNLHWAWLTGIKAGIAAAKYIKGI